MRSKTGNSSIGARALILGIAFALAISAPALGQEVLLQGYGGGGGGGGGSGAGPGGDGNGDGDTSPDPTTLAAPAPTGPTTGVTPGETQNPPPPGPGGPEVTPGDEETKPGPEVTPGDEESPAGPTAEGPSEGTLPFTGLDVGLLIFGGLALLGLGVGMRRLSQRPTF